ncbi:MAG: glycosyl hydrolase, partial [Bacteroidota bacterium]
SVDGGETWNEMTEGLPEEKGKMAISVCQSNPQKVYALIEGNSNEEKGGLFVSNNAGKSWNRISKDHRLVQRAWYYIEVFADPQNENTVYVLSAPALRSIDGGRTWERLSGTHGDYHDLWINPNNTKNLCIANDGGAAISFNYGKSWSTQSNMPTAQFYRINVDNGFPYRIYGGQQDNSSISIAHREFGSYGISAKSWASSAGGESAFLAFDPDDPRYVLGGSYLGTIEVLDNTATAGTKIMAAPIQYLGRDASDMRYRFNWNAPIIWSQHESNTFYHASQMLLRTKDRGQTWEEASPDLTRNEKEKQGKGGGPLTNEAVGAENYGTISYVIESQHDAGIIWVGTDDGYVQLTKDGGKNWMNVTPKGLEECLVNAIDISPHDPGTAYIATTRYKFNDHTPKLMKTTNYGKTWTDITANIPMGAYTRVVREDDKRKDLLFAGTETGIYISWDGGKKWANFNLNLPITPILDLKIKHDDLIVATSGRSFWILDDMELIRQYKGTPEQAMLYQPEDALLTNGGSELNGNRTSFNGTHPLRGVNPANGVVIYYYLPEEIEGELTLTIRDKNKAIVRKLSSQRDDDYMSYAGGPPPAPRLSKKKGLNCFVWDMCYPTMKGIPTAYIEANYRGHKAAPGSYNLTMQVGDKKLKTTCTILENPLYGLEAKDYEDHHQFMMKVEKELNSMHQMVNDMMKLQNQLSEIIKDLGHDGLKKEAEALVKKMKEWDEEMVQRKSKAYDDVENFPNKFTANYFFAINHAVSEIPKVNQPTRDRIAELDVVWAKMKKEGEAILHEAVPRLNEKLWKEGIGALWMGKK